MTLPSPSASAMHAGGSSAASMTTAYCLIKSRPTANFSYDDMLKAYNNNGVLGCGKSSTVVILPARLADQCQSLNSHRPVSDNPAANLLSILKAEAVAIDIKQVGEESRVWILPIDSLSVLGSMSRLGFIASENCTVDHDGVHTWTLRCCTPVTTTNADNGATNCPAIKENTEENSSSSSGQNSCYLEKLPADGSMQLSTDPLSSMSPVQQQVLSVQRRTANNKRKKLAAEQHATTIAPPPASRQKTVDAESNDNFANVDDAVYTLPLTTDQLLATTPDGRTGGTSCPICQKSFRWVSGTVRHMRSHTGEKPFACIVCGRLFPLKHRVIQHIRMQHRVTQSKAMNNDLRNENLYVCPHCPSSSFNFLDFRKPNSSIVGCGFKDAASFVHHIRHEHELQRNMSYKCTMCEQTFTSIELIGMHYNTEHPTNSSTKRTTEENGSAASSDADDDVEEQEIMKTETTLLEGGCRAAQS